MDYPSGQLVDLGNGSSDPYEKPWRVGEHPLVWDLAAVLKGRESDVSSWQALDVIFAWARISVFVL